MKVQFASDGRLIYDCPGCKCSHGVVTKFKPYGHVSAWFWNESYDKPTINPSVLVKWDFDGNIPNKICHHYVENGQLKFLSDCTHELAGQTVDMIDLSEKVENV